MLLSFARLVGFAHPAQGLELKQALPL